MKELTLQQIADLVGGRCDGDGSAVIHGVAGLREAVDGDISFLANPKYASLLKSTKASGALVAPDYKGSASCALIRVDNPDAAFAKVAMIFAVPLPSFAPGIHPSAVVSADAKLGKDVYVGPQCVIESGAVVGDGTVLIAQCYIGHGAHIGKENRIYPNVTIREYCRTGARVNIHSSAVIGSDGFGYSVDAQGVRTKIPQIGIVELGDDVEVGAATTIDRARFGRTLIGNGVKIDNLVQVAHNVVIGDHSVLVAQVGISGSTVLGKHVIMAGQSGAIGHLAVGDGVIAEARTGITKDVPPGTVVYGFPAEPRMQAAKVRAHVQRLPQLNKKVKELEARLKELEGES